MEVDGFLQARRRTLIIGVIAVNLAVKDTRGEGVEFVA